MTNLASRDIKPADGAFGLELTAAWLTLVEVFLALATKLEGSSMVAGRGLLVQLGTTCKQLLVEPFECGALLGILLC